MIKKIKLLLFAFVISFFALNGVHAKTSLDYLAFPFMGEDYNYIILYNKSEDTYYYYTKPKNKDYNDTSNPDTTHYLINKGTVTSADVFRIYMTNPDRSSKKIGLFTTGWKFNQFGYSKLTDNMTWISDFSKNWEVIANDFPIYDNNNNLLYSVKEYLPYDSVYDDIPDFPINLTSDDVWALYFSMSKDRGKNYMLIRYTGPKESIDKLYYSPSDQSSQHSKRYDSHFGVNTIRSEGIYNKYLEYYYAYSGRPTWTKTTYSPRICDDYVANCLPRGTPGGLFSMGADLMKQGILYTSRDLYFISARDSVYYSRHDGMDYDTKIIKANASEYFSKLITHSKEPIYYETEDGEKLIEGYHVNFMFKSSDINKYKYEFSINNGKTYTEFNPLIPSADNDFVGVTVANKLHLKVYENTKVSVRVTDIKTGDLFQQDVVEITDVDTKKVSNTKHRIDVWRYYNTTEVVDGVKKVTSEKVRTRVKTVDTDKYVYRYSMDNGKTWKKVKKFEEFLPLGLELIFKENNTYIFEIRNKSDNRLINSKTVVIDGIGMTVEEYENAVLNYNDDEDNKVVKFFKDLMKEKFPIIDQVSNISKLVDVDGLGNNPPSLELDLSFVGGSVINAVDLSFYERYRDYVFLFIKLTVGFITVFRAFKLVSEEVKH